MLASNFTDRDGNREKGYPLGDLVSLDFLRSSLVTIPSAWVHPTIFVRTYNSSGPILNSDFDETSVRDWATIEAELSERYASGEFPPLSELTFTTRDGPWIGINHIAEQVAYAEMTMKRAFPYAEDEFHTKFSRWLQQRLDDPGFYHFCVQFNVLRDPDFFCFLWALYLRNPIRAMNCFQDKVLSPAGLELPSLLARNYSTPSATTALGHFCSYEGFALAERFYIGELNKLRSQSPKCFGSGFAGPFTRASNSRFNSLFGIFQVTLPRNRLGIFWVPIMNESLRRLNSTLKLFPDYLLWSKTAKEAKDDVEKALMAHDYSLKITSLRTISVSPWGELGLIVILERI